jgi:hypothetical protein
VITDLHPSIAPLLTPIHDEKNYNTIPEYTYKNNNK